MESKEFDGRLELELEDGNPFVWNITIWGPMMTSCGCQGPVVRLMTAGSNGHFV